MGRFAQVYSNEIQTMVVGAIVDGRMSAPAARKALEAGELGEVAGPIPSLELIRLWAKKERHKRQGVDLTDLAKGDLTQGVDAIARRLLAQCDRLTQQLPDNPKTLVDIANVLGKVRDLASPQRPPEGRTQAQKAPASPFTEQLRKAAKRTRSSVPPKDARPKETSDPQEDAHAGDSDANANARNQSVANGGADRFAHAHVSQPHVPRIGD